MTIEGCEPLSAQGGIHGVLVVHGFTGCPRSMRPVAEAFADAGFTVEMPLLPGHGTSVDDMITTGWADWSGAADDAYVDLAGRCADVVVVGLSMGGALTAWLATRHPGIAGIVCINPIVEVDQSIVDLATQLMESGQDRIDSIGNDIAKPDAAEGAYDATPLAPLVSLAEGATDLRADLGKITSPLLLLTSPQDHTVPPPNSDVLAAAVSGPVERIALERSYHVATLDYDADLIVSEALAFAARVTA